MESEGTLEYEFEEYSRENDYEDLPMFEDEEARTGEKEEQMNFDYQSTSIEPAYKPSVIKRVIEVFQDDMDFTDPLKDDFQPLMKQRELPEETLQMLLKQANKAMRQRNQNNLDFLD